MEDVPGRRIDTSPDSPDRSPPQRPSASSRATWTTSGTCWRQTRWTTEGEAADWLRGPILGIIASSTSEVGMGTEQPRVIRPDERTVASGPATPGMVREVAFAGDDRWVGFVRSEAGVRSGWHHHGDTDTYICVLRGCIELEFRPGGHERLEVSAGDFAYVTRGVIHREGTTAEEPGETALVRVGRARGQRRCSRRRVGIASPALTTGRRACRPSSTSTPGSSAPA